MYGTASLMFLPCMIFQVYNLLKMTLQSTRLNYGLDRKFFTIYVHMYMFKGVRFCSHFTCINEILLQLW